MFPWQQQAALLFRLRVDRGGGGEGVGDERGNERIGRGIGRDHGVGHGG